MSLNLSLLSIKEMFILYRKGLHSFSSMLTNGGHTVSTRILNIQPFLFLYTLPTNTADQKLLRQHIAPCN